MFGGGIALSIAEVHSPIQRDNTMKRLITLVTAVLVLSFAAPSWADTFQFSGSNANGTGSFSFDTTTNTLTVSGALIDTLSTLFDNILGPCTANCNVTGGSLSLSLGGATNVGGVYTFGAGGNLDVNGTVSGVVGATGDLLDASFLSGATLQCAGGTCDFAGELDPNSIALNPSINVYGQVPVSGSALQTLKIDVQGTQSVTDASVLVNTVPQPGTTTGVPEPSSLALFGFGLVGVTGFRKKFLR